MPGTAVRAAERAREYVGVRGPDAASYLQAMVSNDVEGLAIGDACEALLLTPKARVIAPLVVVRRGVDDFLLLTEPGLGERLRTTLIRSRFAAKCEIEREEHSSVLVVGREAPPGGIATPEYGVAAYELIDEEIPSWTEIDDHELEVLRIRAGTPRVGREIDDRVLPAEAGLVERAISFTKGCYPGQEPVARLHYRGHANRGLRVLRLETDEVPEYDAELVHGGKQVGRVTSAVAADGGVVALAYVRREVPDDAELTCGNAVARALH
jgi:folate-binding protein YgfZ